MKITLDRIEYKTGGIKQTYSKHHHHHHHPIIIVL